jgi:hypothetical protein
LGHQLAGTFLIPASQPYSKNKPEGMSSWESAVAWWATLKDSGFKPLDLFNLAVDLFESSAKVFL